MNDDWRLCGRQFFRYYIVMDDDEKDLRLLNEELEDSDVDGEEMLACGN